MSDQPRITDHLAERRFELLVNSVIDYSIYMLDRDGSIVSWNSGARRFKGYEAEEIIGEHYSRFFTKEDREARLPWKALETAATEGRFESEGWRVRKDGSLFWASVVVDPVRDETGELIGFAKVTRDITEKRKAEQALSASEQRFRLLVEGVRDYAIYMLDENGIITNWNSGAQAIKGYSAEEIVGQHFSLFYTEEDRERGEPAKALETALSEGKYEREALRVRKDGSYFWASVVIDSIRGDDGKLIGFAKVTRDITERRRAQQELEETRAALYQSQKLQALGELTGGIAHDFNNLMTVIRGSADLLRRSDLSEDKRARYLEAIIETADRATTLTSHLLAFSRRQPLRPEVVDVNLRLDAFAEVLSRTLDANVEVQLDLAPGLWLTEVDATQLETALLNAAFNARDAMPDGGRLTISTRNMEKEESICITLSDTGQGMPEEVLKRVFEPFFTTKPVGKGTGLGLSQIHGFAAQTGGRAEIDSTEGAGTSISIFLPRTTKAVSPSAEAGRLLVSDKGMTVLLVEDNDHVREFARQLLEDLHYRVISARTGEMALEVFDDKVDFLFSDVVMPGLSGVELAQRARQINPRLPVLLASGYSEEIIAGPGAKFEILSKPYDAQTLTAAIASALQDAKNRS